MKNQEKWAVTLNCSPEEKLEKRLIPIIEYVEKIYSHTQWLITEIDATGKLGNSLTHYGNDQQQFMITYEQFLRILQETGQVIDLEATLIINDRKLIKIFVQDGMTIDILSSGELLSSELLGSYQIVDINLFGLEQIDTRENLALV